MKTYAEAVSAMRLAQLAAKGKGQAAADKMKADNLTSTATKPTPKKALPGTTRGGDLAGGALATRPKKKMNPPSSSALAKTKSTGSSAPSKDAVGKRATSKGYMSTPDATTGKPDKPRTLTPSIGNDLGKKKKATSNKKGSGMKLNRKPLDLAKKALRRGDDVSGGGPDDVYRSEYKDTAS